MKIFQPLYDMAITWSKHKNAVHYLTILSFAESTFFPIPPDVMLAPMSMTQPSKAWYFATLTTVSSIIGGIFGYLLGYYAFDLWLGPWIVESSYAEKFELAKQWFESYGVWVVFIAGFSPIPYKIFTITAGVLSMAFLPFLLASTVARSARFFLVAGLMKWGGIAMEEKLRLYVERLGWLVVVLAAVGYFLLR